MKIRNGFVSNSSSSSFLLLYKEFISGTYEVLAKLKNWKEGDPTMFITANTSCDGDIFEEIDSDKAKEAFLKNEEYWIQYGNQLEAYLGKGINDVDYTEYTIAPDDVGYKLASFWMDYHSLTDYNEYEIKRFNEEK